MNEYDTILAGIFLSMLGSAAAGTLTPLPLNVAVSAGGVVSFAFMYYGMFRKAPL